MVEKVKCKTENCTAMILPSTAESAGGFCMPCKRKADQTEYKEQIRDNRRVVDPFKGITDPVLQTEPAPPPNSGMASSLEEAKAAFKRRYAEVKGGT